MEIDTAPNGRFYLAFMPNLYMIDNMSDDNKQLNLPEREEKILEFWEHNKIFEKSLKKTAKGKPYVFYEGPPTANAAPGIHHLESRSFKDVIPRYKTMAGFFVPRKAGWDTHGLPVEIQVEKALGLKTKKDIEKYGVAQFNEKCRESVWQFKEEWEKSTKRLGFWLDLENPYITYETKYIESLWRIIKEIWKKKLLYQDFKVVPWCPRCETGLSSHEVGQGYKKIREDSIFVKLKLKNKKGEYLLIWTTTPWTLPANVAIAVNPKIEYTKYKIPNHKQITNPDFASATRSGKIEDPRFVSRGARGTNRDKSQISKSEVQIDEYEYVWSATVPPHETGEVIEVVERISGKSLLGTEYEPLFKVLNEYSLGSEPEYKIIAGDFVSTEEGTGMVHLAPAFGDDDMRAIKSYYRRPERLKPDDSVHLGSEGTQRKDSSPAAQNDDRLNYPILHTLNENGTIKKGIAGAGKFAKEADKDIVAELKKRGLFHAVKPYEHDYPHCWRCQTPLLYFAKNAWWIRMTALKEKLLKNNSKINWIPEHIREGRFGEFLREVRDWAFSRERFWGTPLPIWQCQIGKSQIPNPKPQIKNYKQNGCGNYSVVGSLEELNELSINKPKNRYFLMRHGQATHNILNEVGPVDPKFE